MGSTIYEAFKDFEKIFTPTLHLLDDPKQSSYIIAANEFSKHEAGMLAFEHILKGTKEEEGFKAKWAEYKKNCEEISQYGYFIYLGEEEGAPPISILEHIRDSQGNLKEIETDGEYKEKLKKLINELLEIAKH